MSNKPINCRYPDCLNCIYADCRYSELEYADIKEQNQFDKELEIVDPEIMERRIRQKKYNKSENGRKRQKKYSKSNKGKDAMRRYSQSDLGRQRRKRYLQSEKGKEMLKRKAQKQIESGKNAEYCRRYYKKKKAEMAGEKII